MMNWYHDGGMVGHHSSICFNVVVLLVLGIVRADCGLHSNLTAKSPETPTTDTGSAN
jgi:hypothetical protein